MGDYTLAVGTHDPHGFSAGDDAEAIGLASALIRARYGADVADNPQEVATLLGPAGLVTRPSERLDEFLARLAGPEGSGPAVQPGDSNTPDCNGD